MKLTDFLKQNGKLNGPESENSSSESAEKRGVESSETESGDGEKMEMNGEMNLETEGNETTGNEQKLVSGDPRSVDELLKTLGNVGKQLQQPGNPDFGEIPPAEEPEKPDGPPSDRNKRDAKALVEINDWGVSFGLSRWAKEPGDNLLEGMEPYQAYEVEKEDLTEDLADLLRDSGIEIPPGLKFLFTYFRVYGPRAFLAEVNRKLHKKMEVEFERKRAELKAEFEEMKKQFRDDLRREYKVKPQSETGEEANEEEEPEDAEPYEKTTIEEDGSFVYEQKKVAAQYDQFRVRTDWDEPETPPHLKNAPYAAALQGLMYSMIGELKRGEKVILDLLRDGFTQDNEPLQTVFEIPEKGRTGRKSSYESALLSIISEIQRELKETAKKISILKNTKP